MLQTINKKFEGKFDFFYLPIDSFNDCNVGYAFINFLCLSTIESFYKTFNGKKWARFNSEKVCKINYARIQGKVECEKHFEDSSLMKQKDKKLKPYMKICKQTSDEPFCL
jgi:protein phosphatase 1 regulatory subunit 42